MLAIADVVCVLLAVALAVPCAVFVIECALGILPLRRERPPAAGDAVRKVILMPAHDEEAVLGETLTELKPQLAPRDRCLVIADNCSDRTAAIAREHGVQVCERRSDTESGKGFALAFGLEQLAADPPDVVVILDADCTLSEGSIDMLAARAVQTGRPVQADYLVTPETLTPLSVINALAFLVRNRVRPLGLWRLGLPCHLTGSGMAFTWEVLRKAPPTGAYLAEDLLMGLELARLGHPPLYTGLARVRSPLPERREAASAQRTRWEHGQLNTLVRHAPVLLGQGVMRASLALFALGLDLMVPPLAFLVLLVGASTALAALVWWLGGSPLALWIGTASLGAIGVAVIGAWLRFGTGSLPARYVLAIPLYVLWKIPLYIAYLVRRSQKTWERTER